jgi:NAD(P)H-dependent FMN reductase
MKIGIIIGSHRKESQSAKVGHWLATTLKAAEGVNTWLLDLGRSPLPLWDEGVFAGTPEWQVLAPVREELASCDGFVFVVPEWHGMVPSALKNLILLVAGSGELAHKPTLLCAVSASDGGANPIAELRMSSYKNARICYIPEQLIVRKVKAVLNDDAAENDPAIHPYIEQRCRYALGVLVAYARAFIGIRESGKVDRSDYPNGM